MILDREQLEAAAGECYRTATDLRFSGPGNGQAYENAIVES